METKKGNLSWEKLESQLHPWLYEAVKSLGFQSMTPVQASTIPLLSGSKDVIVESVTGSGKTLSFAIPVLQKVSQLIEDNDKLKKGHFNAVVLSPTRELANQIQQVFESLLQFLPENFAPISTQLLIGSIGTVRDDLEIFQETRPRILIATPGRFLDFMSSTSVKPNSVEIVVLDEADKLLDISFAQDVISILQRLPKQRRTGLFSATLSAAGDSIFKTGMTNPVRITVKGSTHTAAPKTLNLSYMMVEPQRKITTMLQIVKEYRFKKCIVYFPTCTAVKYFYLLFKNLVDSNVKFHSLHGQLTSKSRLKTLDTFATADTYDFKHILMTTDVAARGIDIPDVDLVIQIDPPTDPDMFLHRCGRTGRANKVGQAITFLSDTPESHEIEFIDFMSVKNVELNEVPVINSPDHQEFLDKVRKYVLTDRGLHEMAIKSYVGFVKYYSKHVASSIFRLSLLDYIGLAKMFGLLRLPKMPETKYIPNEMMPEDGWLGEKIDMDKYAYADEQREKSRLENLEAEKEKKIMDSKRRKELKVKNESWSKKVDTKETKQERREKMKKKREAIEKKLLDESSDDETQEDWKDVVRENKRHKKSEMQGSFDDL